MEEFYKIIAQLGFPIAVTIYVLVRLEKNQKDTNVKLGNLSEKIVELNGTIKLLCAKIKGDE